MPFRLVVHLVPHAFNGVLISDGVGGAVGIRHLHFYLLRSSVQEKLYPMVGLPPMACGITGTGACSLAAKAGDIYIGTCVKGTATQVVRQVGVAVGVAVVPDGKEHLVRVAAIAIPDGLHTTVACIGANRHDVGVGTFVARGVHDLYIDPIVRLARRSLAVGGSIGEKVYGRSHEDGRITDGLLGLTLEFQTGDLADGGSCRGGELKTIPRIAGEDDIGHQFYVLLSAFLCRVADGSMRGDGVACLRADDGELYSGSLTHARSEKDVGTHMSGRYAQAIDYGDAIGTLRPTDGSVRAVDVEESSV